MKGKAVHVKKEIEVGFLLPTLPSSWKQKYLERMLSEQSLNVDISKCWLWQTLSVKSHGRC